MQSIGFRIFRFEPKANNLMVLGNSSVQVRFVSNFQVCQNPPKLGADPVLWENMFLCCFSLQAGRKDLHTGLKFHPPPPPVAHPTDKQYPPLHPSYHSFPPTVHYIKDMHSLPKLDLQNTYTYHQKQPWSLSMSNHSTPHNKGIRATLEALSHSPCNSLLPQLNDEQKILEFIFKHNYFTFNDKHYPQAQRHCNGHLNGTFLRKASSWPHWRNNS